MLHKAFEQVQVVNPKELSKEEFILVLDHFQPSDFDTQSTQQVQPSATYTHKVKAVFEPMLRICGVQGSGNLFADLISIVQGVQSKATLFENLLKYTFEVVRRKICILYFFLV